MGRRFTYYQMAIGSIPIDYDAIFGDNYYDHWRAWDAGSLTLTGALVDQADSLTGSGRNLVSSGGARPTLVNVSKISRKAFDFDGISEYMEVLSSTADYNFLHDTSGGCVIIVYSNLVTPAIQGTLLANGFGDIGFRIIQSNSNVVNTVVRNAVANIAVNVTTETTTNGEYNSFVNVHDINNATLLDRIESVTNGVSGKFNTSSGTPTLADAANNLTVGKRATSADFYFNGTIAEIIIADTIPTPTQLAQVQARLEFDYSTFPIT